jgi:predicted metal-dependent peptidase
MPRIAVFVDTSGSMEDDDFGLALGMINKIIGSFRLNDGIHIITGDTEAKTQVHAAGHVSKLKLKGGGGTDVGEIINTGLSLLTATPHVAVAITDGYTEWPKLEKDIGLPVLAVITRPKRDNGYYQIPSWIETLYLKE